LREFLAQRGEIAQLRARTAAQEQRVAQLQEQKQRWQDPAYVKAQARQRLHFAMPGDTAWITIPEDATAGRPAGPAKAPEQRPWYSDMWASVEAASAGESAAPRPAARPVP
jgi:hypothetical protein